MEQYNSERVINGTFGEMWVNGDYMAETTALEAKVTLEKTEVNQNRTLAKGYKVTGIDCKGTMKLHKVSSYFIDLMTDNIQKGKNTSIEIMSNLEDPDAFGAERIVLKGCLLDEMTLINWESKKLGEESIPFTFTSWEILESI